MREIEILGPKRDAFINPSTQSSGNNVEETRMSYGGQITRRILSFKHTRTEAGSMHGACTDPTHVSFFAEVGY